MGVWACGREGVVLAMNGETVEGRNMSSDCVLNRSHKRCVTIFYLRFTPFYFICILLPLLC